MDEIQQEKSDIEGTVRPISRRQMLGASAVTGVGVLAGAAGFARGQAQAVNEKVDTPTGKTIRLVHFADIHSKPEDPAPAGFRKALKQAEAANPQAILCTGDMIHGGMAAERKRIDQLWTTFQQAKSTSQLPWYVTLGNHDIWGWDKKKSKTTGQEEGWGKARAMKELSMSRLYSSFSLGDWRLITLDSLRQEATDRGYMGLIDDAQFDWLKAELSKSDKPTLIASHMPILSVAPIEWSEPEGAKMNLSTTATHRDAKRLVNLFREHPQVKLCMSGHIHLRDRLEYAGVTYILGGAVCGNWWRGDYLHVPPGFGVLDLKSDGRFDYEYQPIQA